eukprot:COSAG06_NODE_26081_length_622_cov_0.810707_2_plen_38_part_01
MRVLASSAVTDPVYLCAAPFYAQAFSHSRHGLLAVWPF